MSYRFWNLPVRIVADRPFWDGQLQLVLPCTSMASFYTLSCTWVKGTEDWLCQAQGEYMWRWKDRIDKLWMAKYGSDLQPMEAPLLESSLAIDSQCEATLKAAHMRCAGCGSKVLVKLDSGLSILNSCHSNGRVLNLQEIPMGCQIQLQSSVLCMLLFSKAQCLQNQCRGTHVYISKLT